MNELTPPALIDPRELVRELLTSSTNPMIVSNSIENGPRSNELRFVTDDGRNIVIAVRGAI